MTSVYIFLTGIPLWHWLVIVATFATFALAGAVIEIIRSRHHFSKTRTKGQLNIKVSKGRF